MGTRREKEREIKKMGECDIWLITTQIILFHTLNTPDFEYFLHSNQPNWPSWHVKDLAMLLIKFCAKFSCFHRLYILKLGI